MLLFFKQTALSWFSLSFNVDDGVIDLEAVAGRLSYASSLLLASVAFLYISAESIPKLPYLTTLDQMILYGFLNLFLVMTETYIAFRMSKSWSSTLKCFFKLRNLYHCVNTVRVVIIVKILFLCSQVEKSISLCSLY